MDDLLEALLALDTAAAKQILASKSAELGALQAIEEIMAPVLEEIGERWETGEVALAQVYMSGRIAENLINGLFPEFGFPTKNCASLIGLAGLEDSHALGKRIVGSVLKMNGIPYIDYGCSISAADLAEHAHQDGIQILLVSTLMLRAALKVKELKELLSVQKNKMKIVVGGAPFRLDTGLWQEVGADAMAMNAGAVPQIIQRLQCSEEKEVNLI